MLQLKFIDMKTSKKFEIYDQYDLKIFEFFFWKGGFINSYTIKVDA